MFKTSLFIFLTAVFFPVPIIAPKFFPTKKVRQPPPAILPPPASFIFTPANGSVFTRDDTINFKLSHADGVVTYQFNMFKQLPNNSWSKVISTTGDPTNICNYPALRLGTYRAWVQTFDETNRPGAIGNDVTFKVIEKGKPEIKCPDNNTVIPQGLHTILWDVVQKNDFPYKVDIFYKPSPTQTRIEQYMCWENLFEKNFNPGKYGIQITQVKPKVENGRFVQFVRKSSGGLFDMGNGLEWDKCWVPDKYSTSKPLLFTVIRGPTEQVKPCTMDKVPRRKTI